MERVRENWQRIDLISCIVLVFGFQFTFVVNTKLILSSWSVEIFHFGALAWISICGGVFRSSKSFVSCYGPIAPPLRATIKP